MVTARRKLPIGIQTFRKIREEGCYYVDKTAFMQRLVDEGAHYFLSRPRRFGKSLFLDTLKELFEGNQALFEGLAVHDTWTWTAPSPVLRLDFSKGSFKEADYLHRNVMAQFDAIAEQAGVGSRYDTAPERFAHLIRTLHERTEQRVAVLVDEYDKPILDAIAEPHMAQRNRDYLRGLYGAIKFSDAHVRFTFLTGVSKFSKVSLFSDLNNLTDLTLEPDFSAVCGYTEADLDTVFAPELPGLDRTAIRDWYNGYHWLGAEKLYNPYDILLLFRRRRFGAWWFETATPAFLIETLMERGVRSVDLDGMLGSEKLLSAFDVDAIAPETLLFQSGYLTIRSVMTRGWKTYYRLGYPNREVRQSLNESLLDHLAGASAQREEYGVRLYDLLHANDFAGLKTLFAAFFAIIPHQWHTNNPIARYEGYYASVFYSYFTGAGLEATVEDSTSRGRLDMAVRFNGNVYLFEIKVVDEAPPQAAAENGTALAQLRERGYADKYRHLGQPIHLIGVEFSRESRTVAAFETALA